MRSDPRRRLHGFFDAGVLFKGAEGLLELVSGIWFGLDPGILHNVLFRLTEKELLRDPADRISNAVRHVADTLTLGSHTFAVVYLAGHGLIKLVMAVGLLQGRRWAFPLAMVVLSLFAAYQLYRFSHTHSPLLPVLSALDIGIVWLVWREARARGTPVPA